MAKNGRKKGHFTVLFIFTQTIANVDYFHAIKRDFNDLDGKKAHLRIFELFRP